MNKVIAKVNSLTDLIITLESCANDSFGIVTLKSVLDMVPDGTKLKYISELTKDKEPVQIYEELMTKLQGRWIESRIVRDMLF